MNEATAYVLSCTIGPFLLFFLLQYGAVSLKRPGLQPWLSLPFPLLAGGGFLLSLYKTAVVTGWGGLGWAFLTYLTGFALAGTGLGWLLARRKRK